MIVRYEDNRIDKLMCGKFNKKIEKVVNTFQGINDFDLYVKSFEERFAKHIGTKFSFTTASGTDALQLSLLALGIGKGDSVIVPSLTYPSTALIVKYVGAKPILIDVKEDLTIDEAEIENVMEKDTNLIIPVHMFGHTCNMDTIMDIARKRGIHVVEDACQAEGSTYNGGKVGSFGDLNATSFSYYKTLASVGGKGGIITYNDERFTEMLNDFTTIHADSKKLLELKRGFNKISLLDLITVGIKLTHSETINKSRKKAMKIYESELGDVEQIEIFRDKPGSSYVMQNYLILTPARDLLSRFLRKMSIICESPYKPLHWMKAFSDLGYKQGDFPMTERYYNNAVHLPLFTFMKEEEILYVTDTIKKFFSNTKMKSLRISR